MLASVIAMQGVALLAVYGLAALILQDTKTAIAASPQAFVNGVLTIQQVAVDRTWRAVSGVGVAPVVIVILLEALDLIPESPRFLSEVKGSPEAAKKAVQRLKSGHPHTWFFSSSARKARKQQQVDEKKANTSIDKAQWFLGLRRHLLHSQHEHNEHALFNRKSPFALLCYTAISWFLLNVAFFGMGLENPQIISSTWGVTSSTSEIAGERPGYYIRPKDANSLLQRLIVVLEALAGPAIVGYLARYCLSRRLLRRRIMLISSTVVLPSIVIIGIFLTIQHRHHQAAFETEEANNSDGFFTILTYAVFQCFMSLSPSALQFVFAAEVFPTRYRAALLGVSSGLAMLGAIGIRLVVVNVAFFKTNQTFVIFISAGAVFFSVFLLRSLLAVVEVKTAYGSRVRLTLEEISGSTPAVEDLEMRDMVIEC